MSELTKAAAACMNGGLVFKRYGQPRLDSETVIAKALFATIASREAYYACPNIYSIRGEVEMDFLTVTKKHRAYEWEIKRSRQDFLKDLEKVNKRLYYRMTHESGRPYVRKGFIPNRYYMVLVDGDRWLKDEDWQHIPTYASVYIVKQTPAPAKKDPADYDRCLTTFHLVKRGKELHVAPLSPEHVRELWFKMMYRVVGNPALQSSFKETHDHWHI